MTASLTPKNVAETILRPLALCAIGLIGMPTAASAAGTRAGTVIDNVASATYDQSGTPVTVNSNTHSLRVDELLDTVVSWADSADVPTTPGATNQILTFRVTNTGNGQEAFTLGTIATIGGDQFDPTVTSIVIDNGNGTYEPGTDTIYTPGSNDPLLDPDQVVTIFVVSTTPGSVTDGNRGGVRLTSAAKTGTGTPGTTFAGQGEGGGNAVVGTTGADGLSDGYYQVASATVGLVKSATVADLFGGTTSVPGSTITYSIVATISGTGSLANLTINDSIPAGTSFVAGSMRLGATTLTDAADADAGTFASNAIAVSLGTVPGGQTRTISFQVTIN